MALSQIPSTDSDGFSRTYKTQRFPEEIRGSISYPSDNKDNVKSSIYVAHLKQKQELKSHKQIKYFLFWE